jgi:hypothetical protein
VNLWTLTERHVITFRKQLIIPEAVNKLVYQPAWTILVKLGEINIIILSKTQSFITG